MEGLSLNSERRRRRSKEARAAITLQLEHIFACEGLRNFTLGDNRGLVIAGAGQSQESDVLAAYAPLLARVVDRTRREAIFDKIRAFMPDVTETTLHVRRFHIDKEELFLCLLGHPGVYQHVGLYRAVTGVRRILDQVENAA